MKKLMIVMALLLTASQALAAGINHTRSYVRKDGTFVQGHVRSNPDRRATNNQSFYGNYNYSGGGGTNRYQHDVTSSYFNGTPNSNGKYGHQKVISR